MSEKTSKKDNSLITMSQFFNKFNSKHNLFNEKSVSRSKYAESNLNKIPYEILIKIFKSLNVADLINCSYVCKDWYKASNDNIIWVQMGKKYQCIKELDIILSDSKEKSFKKAFKSLYSQKRDLKLFKLNEKLSKKTNNYTGLPDLKTFLNEIESLDWYMNVIDKKENVLLSLKANEFNNFEAGFSVIWSNLNELDDKIYIETEKIKIFVNIPVYIDLKSGKLTTKKEKSLFYNINSKKVLIKELNINLKDFHNNNKNLKIYKIHEDSLINMHNVNKDLIIAFWTHTKNELAFLSFNSIFDFNLVDKIFGSVSNTNKTDKSSKIKGINYNKDLELDSKLGLHDYKVYMCIRNQTKTTFVTISQTVYKSNLKKYKNQEFLHLNVIGCDMINDMGAQLSMLPIFSWKTEAFKKNNIELLSIIDLCIFDSNNKQFLSNTFALNFTKGQKENNNSEDLFISNENYRTEFKDDNFIIELNLTILKDEFTFGNNNISYHLNKMDIYLSLDLVDSWFGTNFNKHNFKKTNLKS